MKKQKIYKIVLVVLIIIFLCWIISSTYSKYITSRKILTKAYISKWNIKVNDQNITENDDFTSVVSLDLDSSPHIAENVIVPTSKGTIDIDLDSTNTDLPFEYNLKIAEEIDTKSTYHSELTGLWGDATNGYTYQLQFTIDYAYLDHPIVYEFDGDYNHVVNELHQPWQAGTGWGLVYNDIKIDYNGRPLDTATYGTDPVGLPVTLELPEGMSLLRVYNAPSYTYDDANHKVTFIPVYYDWYGQSEENLNTTDPYNPDWDPYITIKRYAITNRLTCNIELKYNPPSNNSTLPENYLNSVSANGRTVIKKNLADFKITKYQINSDPIVTLAQGDTNITGRVDPSLNPDGTNTGNSVITHIKLWAEWYDGPDNISDNFHDVMESKQDVPYGLIPLNLKVTQIDE